MAEILYGTYQMARMLDYAWKNLCCISELINVAS